MPEPPERNREWLVPDWPAPANVHARVSLRQSPGMSLPPHASCNLGTRCGDDAAAVAWNRSRLAAVLDLPSAPRWLQQVHGIAVAEVDDLDAATEPRADAAVTSRVGTVLAVLTADCLPVLLCRTDGSAVAAVHAGWRGLAAGVVEAACAALGTRATPSATSSAVPATSAIDPGISVSTVSLSADQPRKRSVPIVYTTQQAAPTSTRRSPAISRALSPSAGLPRVTTSTTPEKAAAMQPRVNRAGRRPRSHQSAIAVIDGCRDTMIAACSARVRPSPAKTNIGEPAIPITPIADACHARP